ncbi:cytochrome P450 [Actinomycetospora cinnamomea]|uniref:Cytochrome P450 n=1 Tax=Actinomycetospora cinnamomea TaxID=663609 RepID=A0A2U1EXD2_9PSEU|nr:cytochrome P450 [Actinomycetospora cinnamomea]PVZ04582.1 cytochrome P450 [Actinomycetospora cinnamomea]
MATAEDTTSEELPAAALARPGFWGRPPAERDAVFAALRRSRLPQRVGTGAAAHWALVRHADVVAASRHPAMFLSGPGVTTPPPARWVRAVFGDSMVNMDDPAHARLRRIVARAFSPRLLAATEEAIHGVAARIVDDLARDGADDLMPAVATRMPVEVVCDLMGVPDAERAGIVAQVDRTTEGTGSRRRMRIPGRSLMALAGLHRVMARVARERRLQPRDDLVSALVAADIDGRGLTRRELGAFFSLLLVAGVETTRNAIGHGLVLLSEHPDQRAVLLDDLDTVLPTAVDEIVRVATPIIQFRRTLAADHELGGRAMARGDSVVLYYVSANRDEDVFTDPGRVDLRRSPNPHVGFGGGGPHYCLGAHLARQEMTALYGALLRRFPDLRTASPTYSPSGFDHRIARLPLEAPLP